jgi:hypothetical protein
MLCVCMYGVYVNVRVCAYMHMFRCSGQKACNAGV